MAQSIQNLGVGSKIKDNKGNIFTLIAHNHYGSNQVTLMHTNLNVRMELHSDPALFSDTYETSNVHKYLNNGYLNKIQSELAKNISSTTIKYKDYISKTQSVTKTMTTKVFIPALKEVKTGVSDDVSSLNYIRYFDNNFISEEIAWTRTEGVDSNCNHALGYGVFGFGYQPAGLSYFYTSLCVVPFFNMSYSTLVTDKVSNGYYSFVFNEPPVIQNISNIKGNYGTPTDITYTATDSDDTNLTHYISFNNGTTYTKINPSKNGDIYTYSHIFNELNTYYCRIKVVDSADNATISNAFTVTVSSVAPTVGIVSVVGKDITFKVNCITSDISKVEVLVNDDIVKTFESGFSSNLSYEVNRSVLNLGKNSIQIKATSEEGLIGYANLEANKEKYQLPPAGTKVEINGNDYFVLRATENESYQTYTLTENLKTNVGIGDLIKVSQDNVKVLCSLSNLENVKDYKEMKLVKTKKLKGDFEGYVEEKYELQGEGRYSAIKLDLEKFSSSAQTEVLELQQYFDYLED